MALDPTTYFPKSLFVCTGQFPLIVRSKNNQFEFIKWANQRTKQMQKAIHVFRGIVYRKLVPFAKDLYGAFEANTGCPPKPLITNSPRNNIPGLENIYQATSVDPPHHIPLHSEGSSEQRKHLPLFIGFYCVKATPKERYGANPTW